MKRPFRLDPYFVLITLFISTLPACLEIREDTLPTTAALSSSNSNPLPVANSEIVRFDYNTPTNVNLSATQAFGDPLSYAIVIPPSHGTLSGTAPLLTFTPTNGYSGSDSFTYQAIDGANVSTTKTVTLAITLYWDNDISTPTASWGVLKNWWLNATHTIQSPRVPVTNDFIYLHGNTFFSDGPPKLLTLSGLNFSAVTWQLDYSLTGNMVIAQGGALVLNSSQSWGGVANADVSFIANTTNYGTINGNAVFGNTAYNYGTVNGTAVFGSNSQNFATVIGTAIFNDTSTNLANIQGTATFNDGSTNALLGSVSGNADFNNGSLNRGTVLGSAEFHDLSSSTYLSNIGGNAKFFDAAMSLGTVAGTNTCQFGNSCFPPAYTNIYWFSTGADTNWLTVGNWWSNSAHTIAAGRVPQDNDYVYLLGVNAPTSGDTLNLAGFDSSGMAAAFSQGIVNNVTIVSTYGPAIVGVAGNAAIEQDWDGTANFAILQGGAHNYGNINGDAIFKDASENNATVNGDAIMMNNTVSIGGSGINGNAIFKDNVQNLVPVAGNASFSGASVNGVNASLGGMAWFSGTSVNLASLAGNAYFKGSSSNQGSGGVLEFDDSSSNLGTFQRGTFNDSSGNNNSNFTVAGNLAFNGNSTNSASGIICQGNTSFSGSSLNVGTIAHVFGNLSFSGQSINNGVITAVGGNINFTGQASNTGGFGTVVGAVNFYDTSSNSGTFTLVSSGVNFYGQSTNTNTGDFTTVGGTVAGVISYVAQHVSATAVASGNVTFNDNSANSGTFGLVGNSVQFNDQSVNTSTGTFTTVGQIYTHTFNNLGTYFDIGLNANVSSFPFANVHFGDVTFAGTSSNAGTFTTVDGTKTCHWTGACP